MDTFWMYQAPNVSPPRRLRQEELRTSYSSSLYKLFEIAKRISTNMRPKMQVQRLFEFKPLWPKIQLI
jgi:hypothetical protein